MSSVSHVLADSYQIFIPCCLNINAPLSLSFSPYFSLPSSHSLPSLPPSLSISLPLSLCEKTKRPSRQEDQGNHRVVNHPTWLQSAPERRRIKVTCSLWQPHKSFYQHKNSVFTAKGKRDSLFWSQIGVILVQNILHQPHLFAWVLGTRPCLLVYQVISPTELFPSPQLIFFF